MPTSPPMTGTQASLYQQLRGHLATLKPPQSPSTCPACSPAEAEQWSMTATLEHLLARGRSHRSTQTRRPPTVRIPPTPATLADFDFDAAPSVDKIVDEPRPAAGLESATNVLLIGPPGVGKTHLAVGLGRRSRRLPLHHRRRPRRPLPPRRDRRRWATTMRFFAGPTLLVIDEPGYLPLPAKPPHCSRSCPSAT